MPFQLYDLPVEIYNLVMEYAFAVPNEKLWFESDWDCLDSIYRKQQDSTSTHIAMIPPRSPRSLKINDWLVSKPFFIDAAQIWFSAQDLQKRTDCSANLESVLPPWAKTAQRTKRQEFWITPAARMPVAEFGSFYTFATRVDIPWAMIPYVMRCQALEHVEIELRPDDFDLDPRYGWRDVLTDAELEGIRKRTGLSNLPAYQKLEVYCPEGDEVKWLFEPTKRQKDVLQSNARLLQHLLQAKAALSHCICTPECVLRVVNRLSQCTLNGRPAGL
ncbi:hypothetical protein LTR95_009669 [Oleoguttula sp. CCFEE 5521]